MEFTYYSGLAVVVGLVVVVGRVVVVVLGGCWLDKTKLILISTQVEVVVEVWLEKVLKINFHGWVGVGGWIKWE